MPTDREYTGQRKDAGIGLYYYNSRWYDPQLGRFTQADTIISGSVQGYDRYSYAGSNPIEYNDPSGHYASYCDNIPSTSGRVNCENATMTPKERLAKMGVTVGADFDKLTYAQQYAIYQGTFLTAVAFMEATPSGTFYSAEDAFTQVEGPVSIAFNGEFNGVDLGLPIGACKSNVGGITGIIVCNGAPGLSTIIHEYGHVFDDRYRDKTGGLASDNIPGLFKDPFYGGYKCESILCVSHPNNMAGYDNTEEFADMFENWVLDMYPVDPKHHGFDNSDAGKTRRDWMSSSGEYPGRGIPKWLRDMGF
jgi:RHS repeat-associated protein